MAAAGRFPKISHIIFDMDGILLDTEKLYSIANEQALSRFGKEFTWELKQAMMGRRVDDAVKVLLEKTGLAATVSAQQYNEVYLATLKELLCNCEYVPGAEKLARHLHKHGYPLAVCTGSDREQFEWKVRKYADLFDTIFEHTVLNGSDPEVKVGKPAPDCYLIAMKRFKTPPSSAENVLVIEDAPNGVESARAAGCTVVSE